MLGYLLILLGLVGAIWNIYSLLALHGRWYGKLIQAVLAAGLLYLAWYGYRMEYPPTMLPIYGGKRRWYK